jgi:hypothetical protein
MGEARRRKQLIKNILEPARRADIARVVRSVDFVIDGGGGTCASRAFAGKVALTRLGVCARLVFGAMLYRAGPDEEVDVVAYCGQGNRAQHGDGGMLGHLWLEAGPDLIDFSVGDWREQFCPEGGLEPLPPGVKSLPPVRWTTTVPDFWWRPSCELTTPWREHTGPFAATPPLGEAWYHAEPGPLPFKSAPTGDMERAIEILMRDRIDQLLTDWRSGGHTEFVRKTFIKDGSGREPRAIKTMVPGPR